MINQTWCEVFFMRTFEILTFIFPSFNKHQSLLSIYCNKMSAFESELLDLVLSSSPDISPSRNLRS